MTGAHCPVCGLWVDRELDLVEAHEQYHTKQQQQYDDLLRIIAAADQDNEIPTCALCATYQHDESYHEEPTP